MRQFILAMAFLPLIACTSNVEVSVKDRWQKSIRNFALQAVYPMREDVFLGTMRLATDEEDPFSLKSRSLGYIDISGAIAQSEANKPNYPSTSTPSNFVIGSDGKLTKTRTTWTQPFADSALRPTPNIDPRRLRLAALPGVSVVRITEADFARRGLLSAIAGSFRSDANLNIDLTGIESLEIDDVTAFQVFQTQFQRRLQTVRWYPEAICSSAAGLGDPTLQRTQIQMVTRVFYARGIVYNYGTNVSAALKQAKGQEGIINSENVFQESSTNAGDAVEEGGSGNANAQQASQQPNPTKAQSGDVASISPGTVTKIASQSSSGTSLTEIFERPLAFGVTTIAFDPKSFGILCDENGNYVGQQRLVDDRGAALKGKRPRPGVIPAAVPPAQPPVAVPPADVPLTAGCEALVKQGVVTEEEARKLQEDELCD